MQEPIHEGRIPPGSPMEHNRTATVPGEEENSTTGNRENKVLTEIIKTKLLKSLIVQTLEYFLLSCE